MIKNKYLSLVLIILVTFVASGIGSFVTSSYKEPWYSEILLPSFNPPSWVFGPVWTTLYVFMSVAAWSAWKKSRIKKFYRFTLFTYFLTVYGVLYFLVFIKSFLL